MMADIALQDVITKYQLDGLIAAEENGGKFVVLGKPSTAEFGLAEPWEYNPLQWVLTRAGLIVALQEKRFESMNEKELEDEIKKVQARKKPVENAGDWYDEQRREADELRLRIELAKLRGEPTRKLEQDLERALNVGD